MKTSKVVDLLADPVVREHTQRILALQKEERQVRERLGQIIVAIGAELIAVKEALDKTTDKTAWLRWLKDHVRYSINTAGNYMRVARFAKKFTNVCDFFQLDPSVLYRISTLPDEIAATLTPDTLLTDPQTGRQIPLKEMSARQLDRALDALEGRNATERAKRVSGNAVRQVQSRVALTGNTREEFATDAMQVMGLLSDELAKIRGCKGQLTGSTKQRTLVAIEQLRRIVLKWPAWAKPAASVKSRKKR